MTERGKLLLMSAASQEELLAELANILAGHQPHPWNDTELHRLALVADDDEGLAAAIQLASERLTRGSDKPVFNLANQVFYGRRTENVGEEVEPHRVAFMFPGFGAHHRTLMADLLAAFPEVQQWFDALPADARKRFESNTLIHPGTDQPAAPDFRQGIDAILLGSLALHTVLARCAPGLACDAMIGHSYGETAVLAASGMTSQADAIGLLDAMMGAIAQSDPDARSRAADMRMIAVTAASRETLAAFRQQPATTEEVSGKAVGAEDSVFLALDNCPQQAILCGPETEVAAIEKALSTRGNLCLRLPGMTIPVHTPLFPVSQPALQSMYAGMPLSLPSVPVYSATTAAPLPAELAGIREVLALQWTHRARFRETIERLYEDGIRTFVEVGPGGHLAGFARDTLRGRSAFCMATNLENRPTLSQLRCFLAQMFVRGHKIDASAFDTVPLAGGAKHASLLLQSAQEPGLPVEPTAFTALNLEAMVRDLVADLLELEAPEAIDADRGFFELGMGSLQLVELAERLQTQLARPLGQTVAFDHPSISALATYLSQGTSALPATSGARTHSDDIAVIGMGCRLPGGINTPQAFWDFLCAGGDGICPVPDDRWDLSELRAAGVDPDSMPHIFHGGFLKEIRDFDCTAFGISPREAIALDPQQRLLLEVSQEALESACITPSSLKNSATGIFVGISHTEYLQRLSMAERLNVSGYLGTGNAHSTAAGRLSFHLGVHGPCMAVDTACSSSLVALHLACRSLRDGESHLALAGGVNLLVSPETSIMLARAGALSKDSRCQTFDDGANGYVRSEGCGVVVLKRLADAQADGDSILAVVRGSAVNHDGRTSGFTVPSGQAQQALIRQALNTSRISPQEVDYFEAHGTGTSLGDPIELNALGHVFSERPQDKPLILGAVKTNLGHLEAAAGITGFIKGVLQLQHGRIASNLHFTSPNHRVDWAQLPFAVSRSLQPWPNPDRARFAGVSSFGISGTNACAILTQAPDETPHDAEVAGAPRELQILTLSAPSASAAEALALSVAHTLPKIGSASFASFCTSTQLGRDHSRYRIAVVGTDAEQLAEALAHKTPAHCARPPKIAFLFSGQGSQMANMGCELLDSEPAFRAALEAAGQALQPFMTQPLIELLRSGHSLDATALAQPSLFGIQYALCALWKSWGVLPHAVLGHSIGEYAAACAAGMLTLEEAAPLVAHRGRLMQSLPAGGAMLAVHLGHAQVAAFLTESTLPLAIAAINGRHHTVLSGAEGDIARAEHLLHQAGTTAARLKVSHAFHSPLMAPALEPFHCIATAVTPRAGQLPMVSTLTGALLESAPDAHYWTQQLSSTVLFEPAMQTLKNTGCTVFIEIGPRPVLLGLAQNDHSEGTWLASLNGTSGEQRRMLQALADLYSTGAHVDWRQFHDGRPWRRASVPLTPFDRRRLWIDKRPEMHMSAPAVNVPAAPSPTSPPPRKNSLIDRLRATPLQEQPALVEASLRRMVASALGGLAESALEPSEPLNRMGLDSLMAMSLRNELASKLGLDTTLAHLTGEATLESLTAVVQAQLLKSGALSEVTTPEPPSAESEPCPLSYGQRALWFLWQLAPHSSAYGLSLPLEIAAPADPIRWRAACRALVASHPQLRSVFRLGAYRTWSVESENRPQRGQFSPDSQAHSPAMGQEDGGKWTAEVDLQPTISKSDRLLVDGQVVQQAMPAGEVQWADMPVAGWSMQDVTALHRQPFDLEHGPVIRFGWFPRDDGSALLLLSMHHIVSDGWSLELIRRQLPHIATEGAPDTAHVTEASGYRAHVRRQLQLLSSAKGEALWTYWRDQLGGPLPVLDLPTDYPRPAQKGFAGASCAFALSEELTLAMKALAREVGATPYVVFLAGFLALVHRTAGQDDLLVGSPQAGRDHAESALIVGYFTDPLVIRSRLGRDQGFREFLTATRQTVLGALEHSQFPFALLVERLAPQRAADRSPLFDASFNFTPAAVQNDDLPEVRQIEQADGKFDLTLNLRDGVAASGWFGYDTQLFSAAGMARLRDNFIHLLESAVADPERSVSTLATSRARDGLALVPVLSGETLELSAQDHVARRFESASRTHPDSMALVAEDARLSYRQLDAIACRLATQLSNQGLGHGSRVGVMARRTAGFFAAVLAIHKIGAAYVALDPAWPQALLERTIANNAISLSFGEHGPDLSVMADSAGHAPTHPSFAQAANSLDDPAYVIFTSGSTGEPKGVEISHRSLANYVASMAPLLGLEAPGNFALVSTLAADLGLTMVFPSLCLGACLHVLPEEASLDGARFADYIEREHIDYLKIVPSHFAALTAGRMVFPRRVLVFGGEGASPSWVAGLQKAAGACRIFNHYGPTETTIGVLCGEVTATTPVHAGSLPLSHAVAGSEIYLLDAQDNPVPGGAIGHLHVSGPCLALGYLGLASQASFITLNGLRLYRTGDLARQWPDGALEILGRIDRQAKIRGFRIEPAQIESALRRQPGISECAVITVPGPNSTARLLGFVVANGQTPELSALRETLTKLLPAPMVPEHIFYLDALPRNANGKLDTAALALRATPAREEGAQLPRDMIEIELTRIWTEVLGVAQVGIHDDFFSLGGHSLLAVKLLSLIQQKFGNQLSLGQILTHPSIAAQAETLRTAASQTSPSSALISLRQGDSRQAPLYLLPGAGGSIVYLFSLVRALPGDLPVRALQGRGLQPDDPVPRTVEEAAVHHVALLEQAQPAGPVRLAGHSFGALVAYEMARLLQSRGRRVDFLGLIDNAAQSTASSARSDQQWLAYIARRIEKLSGKSLDLGGIEAAADYSAAAHLLSVRMVTADLLPGGMDEAYLLRFLDIYRANTIAASLYRPQPLAQGLRATVLVAEQKDIELELADGPAGDATQGWGALIAPTPKVVVVPGTHLSMLNEPHAQTLALKIAQAIGD
ncbi:type I polyketide synthase [Ottowia thiooxydans]|uniref:type I polyketide synthase n=1 Tax=Ottowia thiooxydans TaxID=219182 RepID=UPI0003F59161|nr:type I polyketide synthase [Ottowia thiooxydans]